MKAPFYSLLLSCLFLFSACEEVIDINLNDADPRTVIEGQLSNLSSVQRIRVSRTVAFTESISSNPITNAAVSVTDNRGRVYEFTYEENGVYVNRNFRPVEGRSYELLVVVDEERYESFCVMPPYVEVNRYQITGEDVFNETFYFAAFDFQDPIGIANYYKYDISINTGAFQFANAFSDRFNDGLEVTHQVSDLDTDLVAGDSITVRRYCVDSRVFDYWNEFQSTNPGSAAPGNPTSNITNNALGYFSVASAEEFGLRIPEEVVVEPPIEE